MILAGLFGCSGKQKEYFGEWVDINSDTVLKVDRSSLVITSYGYSEKYEYKEVSENGGISLVNKNGGSGFDIMSDINVLKNGHLVSYEMILDADGHKYEFVRETEKAELLAIVDDSKDLPKKIKSHEIAHMSLSFYGYSNYKLDDIPEAHIQFELESEDGEYSVRYSESFDSYMGRRFNDAVSEQFVTGLDEVIRNCQIIENNGYYRHNAVDTYSYSLHIEYESDEEVVIRSEGEDVYNVIFDLNKLVQYIVNNLDFDNH